MTPNTDSPNSDAPAAADYDADDAPNDAEYDASYPKSVHLYLRNHNSNRKITPNTKKQKYIT